MKEKTVKRVRHIHLFTFKNVAFTLAEILITLAVIGIVAAVTIPTLINKIQDKQFDRARQKALATIGEAGRIIAIEGNMNSGGDAENFVKNYLSKKLKIVKMCDSNHLEACGWNNEITILANGTNHSGKNKISLPRKLGDIKWYFAGNTDKIKTTPSYGFLMANGFSVNLFYNPECAVNTNKSNSAANDYVCINALYDMNGKARPNQFGKDIGAVTVFYPNETSVAVSPNPAKENTGNYVSWSLINTICSEEGYNMPNKEELMSLAYNLFLTNLPDDWYYSSNIIDGNAVAINIMSGQLNIERNSRRIRCVKRF